MDECRKTFVDKAGWTGWPETQGIGNSTGWPMAIILHIQTKNCCYGCKK